MINKLTRPSIFMIENRNEKTHSQRFHKIDMIYFSKVIEYFLKTIV